MNKFLVVANDPGGAHMMKPVLKAISVRGDQLTFCTQGAAAEIWESLPGQRMTLKQLRFEGTNGFDGILTGTSGFSDLERQVWSLGCQSDTPSIAFLDIAENFSCRGIGPVKPNSLLVCDKSDGVLIRKAKSLGVKGVYEVGYPHLSAKRARYGVSGSNRVLFISEPIAEDFGVNEVIFGDQFSVASHVRELVSLRSEFSFEVRCHPRESSKLWEYNGFDLSFRGLVEDLDGASIVVSVGSQVLVEAASRQVPALSWQIGARRPIQRSLFGQWGIEIATEVSEFEQKLWNLSPPILAQTPTLIGKKSISACLSCIDDTLAGARS